MTTTTQLPGGQGVRPARGERAGDVATRERGPVADRADRVAHETLLVRRSPIPRVWNTSARWPRMTGGHPASRHTPQGGGVPARPGLNQAQQEAARHATRRDKWKGRAEWDAARAEAIWLLARGHKHGALEAEQLLLREVHHLAGRDLVIEADVGESDITLDGRRIRASARPDTPAIRVAFESRYGPLTYATDRFAHWIDNIRAIALGLEALRKVDRYGITKRGEQYAGWKQLPAGSGDGASHMTLDEAWSIIGSYDLTGRTIEQQRQHGVDEYTRAAWRRARAANHPDRRDGDRNLWDQVEQAARALGLS